MHLQEFLRSGGTAADLSVSRAIVSRRHGLHPNLVLFKYSMIDSPMGDAIVRECRGVILDETDNWNVVSRAFDKFFNHGEGHAAPIDWTTARVQEKLDGSLVVVYSYRGDWHAATSGTPDASGDVNGKGTFAKYFWGIFESMGGRLPDPSIFHESFKGLCFIFELMGPDNRIVVVHPEPTLRLLGARDSISGEQFFPENFSSMVNIPAVRSCPLQSFEDIAASFEHMSPLQQEGYVVVDGSFNRVKVKHPGYLALHHAKDGMTSKTILEIARSGETSEVVTAFPEFAPLLEKAKTQIDDLVARINANFAALKDIPEQKAFAQAALKTGVSPALFALRSKKAPSARAFVASITLESLERLLNP